MEQKYELRQSGELGRVRAELLTEYLLVPNGHGPDGYLRPTGDHAIHKANYFTTEWSLGIPKGVHSFIQLALGYLSRDR